MRHFRPYTALVAVLVSVAASSAALGAQNPAPPRTARDSLMVTFLANEGVMLSAAGATIIIDGLSGEGLEGYGVVSPANRRLLERALPPFDRVNAVLTTHIHRDHFDAPAVLSHLRANPRATFISTTEAVAQVRAAESTSVAFVPCTLATPAPASRNSPRSDSASLASTSPCYRRGISLRRSSAKSFAARFARGRS
jgi:hypothetical protein